MKYLKPLVFALICLSIVNCSKQGEDEAVQWGKNITPQFLSSNSGAFIDPQDGSKLAINSDGTFAYAITRQVGSKDDQEVPYGTNGMDCRYIEHGKITKVYERSTESKKRYMDIATHVILMDVNQVELVQNSKDNTSEEICQKFAKRQNSKVPLKYDRYSEVLSNNQIRLHTSGGGDYNQGGPRTESTLDENYYREGSPELVSALHLTSTGTSCQVEMTAVYTAVDTPKYASLKVNRSFALDGQGNGNFDTSFATKGAESSTVTEGNPKYVKILEQSLISAPEAKVKISVNSQGMSVKNNGITCSRNDDIKGLICSLQAFLAPDPLAKEGEVKYQPVSLSITVDCHQP